MTTEPAETMLPSPIVTPGKMMQRRPIQTLSLDRRSAGRPPADGGSPARRAVGSDGWPLESNIQTSEAIRQCAPDRDPLADA